ncbi:hypothetical protein RclHR1_12190007 [Rhizophagus clarus]|uniref:Uncharacterized protein n=1 Tax=Rhizophagus clarus TaxID=94130 RepID=A0A2Z6Q6H0_9GLOM|nr:hypothetical protein RclHR1_12190007 [Rhizophagus clarus]GES99063.1 hypothetical protein GLOIN_2v1826533 [Rhizophagus clarus]
MSNNDTTQDLQNPDNNNNEQHTLINNAGISNAFINTATPVLQNATFEFYFPLPNDTRIYYVTYTELNHLEIAQRLNNNINLSHIPGHQFPHHYNIQSWIRQLIQQVQQPDVYQQNSIQQNSIQQQSFDTQSTFQVYSDDNTCDTTQTLVNNEAISDDAQDTENVRYGGASE